LGYAGKVCIIPLQSMIASKMFKPSSEELRWANKVLKATAAHGKAAIRFCDQSSRVFVGPPHISIANSILARQKKVEEVEAPYAKSKKDGVYVTAVAPPRAMGVDFHSMQRGDVFEAEYEITVSDSWLAMWNASFIAPSRFSNSSVASQSLPIGPDHVPFTMLTCLALSLAVSRLSESAVVHLGVYNARQLLPVKVGDQLRAFVKLSEFYKTSSGNVVIDSTHALVNHRGETVFVVGKRTMFPKADPSMAAKFAGSPPVAHSASHLIERGSAGDINPFLADGGRLASIGAMQDALACQPGQLLVHNMVKVFGESEVRSLCNTVKITNPHHFVRFSRVCWCAFRVLCLTLLLRCDMSGHGEVLATRHLGAWPVQSGCHRCQLQS
jgi:hypothetical protein